MGHYKEKIAVAPRENLEKKVIEIWEEIYAETVRHLDNSFQSRLEKAKSNKGAIIGYQQLYVTFRIVDF